MRGRAEGSVEALEAVVEVAAVEEVVEAFSWVSEAVEVC